MLIVEMEKTGKIKKKGKKTKTNEKRLGSKIAEDGNIKLKTDFNTLSISV